MSGASGITTKGSVTKNKSFSSVSLGYSTLCVLRHDAIQDVFFLGHTCIKPSASGESLAMHLTLTPTARAEYTKKEGHVYQSRADGEGGLHAWVALPLTQATGPHSVARSKRKRRIPKHLGYASPLTQTPPTFSFQPTNQIRRGTQKDRFNWSPSVTLGGSLARSGA